MRVCRCEIRPPFSAVSILGQVRKCALALFCRRKIKRKKHQIPQNAAWSARSRTTEGQTSYIELLLEGESCPPKCIYGACHKCSSLNEPDEYDELDEPDEHCVCELLDGRE